jgi:hypothetical protein
VILLRPDAVLLEDTKDTFHVLVDPSAGKRTELQYCGIYTKVRTRYIMEVQPDEWHALPRPLRRVWRTGVGASASEVHARCSLREKLGSEPSLAEIVEWLRNHRNGYEALEKQVIPNGFNSGVEKFRFEAIICVGYDVKLAKLIRDGTYRHANCLRHAN